MILRTLRLPVLTLLAVLLAPPAEARFAPGDRLPSDPAVTVGTLENGLTYYLRANARPENRVELRLVVNAGSALEEEDQQGLAHFLEHMAFNGTTNYPENDLIDYLESIGSRFGPDLNAYTSFDETVYMLTIPTDREGLVDTGLRILRDWAGNMSLTGEGIEGERGVVLEEWRLGQGAQERLRKVHWPVLYRGSRYAERLPIGTPEVIRGAPPERIRDFYRRWYRPDLMAVVAVGTIDPKALEARIREVFGDLVRPATPAARPAFDVPPHRELLASSADDPEQPVTQIWLAAKLPAEPQGTFGVYRRGIAGYLVTGMLNERLDEIKRKPDPPFQFAVGSLGAPVRATDMFSAFAFTPENAGERGLRALLVELERMRAHGFTAGELERGKAEFLAGVERMHNERDKTESGPFADEYVRHFLEGEPFPGIALEHEIAQWLLPEITLDEVNALARELLPGGNTVILASGPRKEGVSLPGSGALLAVARAAEEEKTEAYVDAGAGKPLMATLPAPGAVRTRSYRADLGVTTVVFENGLEAWLKPTDFKNDQILFSALTRGGKSAVDTSDYASASLAGQIVAEGGIGGHTPVELQKLLAGKLVSASVQIGDLTHGISGSAVPKELETALQLVYLHMTAPDRRPETFTVLKDRLRTVLRNRTAQPEARFGDRVALVNHRNHYMYRPWTEARLDEVDLDRALAFHRSLYADASDFRFHFVGAIDVDATIPLLARYLGSLPSRRDGPGTFRDPGVRFPDGVVREKVLAGVEPKSSTQIAWRARASMDETEMFLMRLASDILEIRLRDLLREELGSNYSLGVGYEYTPPYTGYATTSVGFGSSPENAERMTAAVFEEVARFKKDGPTPAETEKVKELERRAVETGLRENGYWLASFQTLQLLGWAPERILARRERIEAVTPDALRDAFRLYFPEENHTVITLLPENGTGAK